MENSEEIGLDIGLSECGVWRMHAKNTFSDIGNCAPNRRILLLFIFFPLFIDGRRGYQYIRSLKCNARSVKIEQTE